MDRSLSSLDWSLIQAFVTVAQTGSLSAAARELNSSQPTVGRQIKAIEEHLHLELFQRQPRGFVLSETGQRLLPHALAMHEAMQQFSLSAAGHQVDMAGTVRITASEMISCYTLPRLLVELRRQEPEIEVELVPSDLSSNLLYREADIAIRMYRPTQLDLITKHLGDVPLAMFAAKSYLARRGIPQTTEELWQHDFVGYDSNLDILTGFRQAGAQVDRSFFKLRCDHNLAYWALVKAGGGIGFGQQRMGRNDPDLQELQSPLPLPSLPVWLTAHEAMRQTPRIRRVWGYLAEGLQELFD